MRKRVINKINLKIYLKNEKESINIKCLIIKILLTLDKNLSDYMISNFSDSAENYLYSKIKEKLTFLKLLK